MIYPTTLLRSFLSNRLGNSATKLELRPRIKTLGGELKNLTASEKAAIVKVWSGLANDKIDFDYWRFYKTFGIADPNLVPDNIYWSKIIRALNPISYTRAYINKSLYPIIFKGLAQPDVLVNVIGGIPYDAVMNRLSEREIIDTLIGYADDIIIKPTRASSGGSRVSKIYIKDVTESELKEMLTRYGNDYICQGVVRQSRSMSVFNPTSLNTFRVNTLNINGTVSCECLMMRHGQNDSVVDNFAKGGIACGMNTSGYFNGVNFNNALRRVEALADGTTYTVHVIDNISDVISTAIEAHQRYMPHIGHAAWDFAIGENNKPVMIEVNLMLPGITLEQLTSGASVFGNRTEEVIKFVQRKNVPWTEFVGGW